MIYGPYSDSLCATTGSSIVYYGDYSQTICAMMVLDSVYRLGPTAAGGIGVKVRLDENSRPYHRPRRILYSRGKKTLQQIGVLAAEWKGVFEFDDVSELAQLRWLYGLRTVYFEDMTTLGTDGAVQVYWAGEFRPEFDTPEAVSGSVPFVLLKMPAGL